VSSVHDRVCVSTCSGHRNLRKPYFLRPPQITATHTPYFPLAPRTRHTATACYNIQVGAPWLRLIPLHHRGLRTSPRTVNFSIVGMTSKTPFLYSFIAGVLSVVVIGALTFLFILSWRYYRGRHKLEPSNKEIRLTTLEDGRTTSDKLGPSFRGPSRLGDNSPSSAESADEAWESQSQFLAQIGPANGAEDDGQRPFSAVSQSSVYIVKPMTTEGVERIEDQPIRAKDSSDPTILGKDGDMSTEHERPFITPSPPGIPIPPLPPAPPKSNGRSSISTVWSQESMWPREKPDDPVPVVPPLAHFPVTRRVMFSPLIAAGFQNRRSTSSLPRSVGQSDFDEDF
jgi:hypothetical protein